MHVLAAYGSIDKYHLQILATSALVVFSCEWVVATVGILLEIARLVLVLPSLLLVVLSNFLQVLDVGLQV